MYILLREFVNEVIFVAVGHIIEMLNADSQTRVTNSTSLSEVLSCDACCLRSQHQFSAGVA